MGRNKSGLEDSNAYQRRVTAWRVAEMLVGDALGQAHPDVIRVEVDEAGDWDDLQEQNGGRIDRWQVKRQQEALPAETLKGLVVALREQPGVWGHLLFMSDVEFYAVAAAPKGKKTRRSALGSLRDLRAMSDRWRGHRVDLAAATGALTAAERPLFDALAGWLGGQSSALETLSRLTVEGCRTDEDLEREGRAACARIFEDADRAWTLIKARFTVRHGEQELRPADLWRHLDGCALQPGLRAPLHVRDGYLRNVANNARADHPLGGLVGVALDLPLWELWVERAVTWDQPAPPTYDTYTRSAEVGASTSLPPEGAPTNPAPPRTETLRDDLRRLLIAPPRKLLAVLGEAGSGKSQLLRRCWADLADRALQDLEAPVPFFLRAQDLARPSIAEGIPGLVGHEAARVHRQRDARFYLVDGLDEVAPKDQQRVQEHLRDLADDPRTIAVAVTCRPSHRVEVPPGAHLLWLEPWSASDAELLMARWERHDAEAVRRLQETPHAASLATSPLILSLALWVAHDEPAALRSRSRVFSRVVEKLALGWPEGRGAPPIEIAERWEELQPPLSALAWEMISGGVAELDRTSVESHLRRVRPARLTLWLDWADRQLGLLVRTGTGGYAFLLRPLAEHLAGLHLATRDDAEILATADHTWGAEVVRHALGHLADQGDYARVQRLIAALVEGWEQDFQTALGLRILVRPVHLRRVLVAARACADVSEAVSSRAEQFAKVFWAYLTEETSAWVGDRMAAAVEEIAAAGGVVWEWLRVDVCRALSIGRTTPLPWLLGHMPDDPQELLFFLLHRDDDVISLVLERMAPSLTSIAGVDTLFAILMLEDARPGLGWLPPPGLSAARLLRTLDIGEWLPRLVESLVSESIAGFLAAVVLMPDEANPAQLAWNLREASRRCGWRLRDIVEDLAKTPTGEAALAALWPEWRAESKLPEPLRMLHDSEATTPAPTSVVRRRLSRALFACTALNDLERDLVVAWARNSEADSITYLCKMADRAPQVVLDLLRPDSRTIDTEQAPRPRVQLPDAAQLALGTIAKTHRDIRDTLIAWWRDLAEKQNFWITYPGRALEGLARAGDEEATTIYAEWISHLPISGAIWMPTVPEDLAGQPQIRARLLRATADLLASWPRQGSLWSIDHLAKWWPAWISSPVVDQLLQHAKSDSDDVCFHALKLLCPLPLPAERVPVIGDVIKQALSRFGLDGFYARATILSLRGTPLATHLAEDLFTLVTTAAPSTAFAIASAICGRIGSGRATDLASRVATNWPQNVDSAMEVLPRSLYEAAPRAFQDRCRQLLQDGSLLGVEAALAVLKHNHATKLRQEDLASAVRTAFSLRVAKVRSPLNTTLKARPLDLLDQLTFDLGLPLLDG